MTIQSDQLFQSLIDKISNLKVWKKKGLRAPHKPFLILLTLASIQQGKERLILFKDIEPPLKKMLEQFGNKYARAEFPFYYLQNDGFWEVFGGETVIGSGYAQPVPKHRNLLIDGGYRGGFTEEIYRMLRNERYKMLRNESDLLIQVAQHTLDKFFDNSLHKSIVKSAGLNMEIAPPEDVMDPEFREEVLNAYKRMCCICRFDSLFNKQINSLEVAYIHWPNDGGVIEINNSVALCTNHYDAFNYGVFTIDDKYRILVTRRFRGVENMKQVVNNYNTKHIILPPRKLLHPASESLIWHHDNVFRKY